MKKFALFVSLAVGVAAAWEISKYLKQSENVSGEKTPDIFDSVSDTVSAVIEPIKDVAVTVTRNVFGTPYDALITSSAIQYRIPPEVLYKLLRNESRFRPDIIDGRTKSPTGALGIAQFMPATAVEELGSVQAALDPNIAIPGAARYLAKLRKSFDGDLTKAVAAYNWGIGNVKRKGLANAPKETVNYAFDILGVNLKG
jgi:soluble lytic murein transglycosylase-like protein